MKALAVTLMLSPMMTANVLADEAALNQRIDRLERIIKGQGLVSLLGRVDQLQNEIQRLNGENEALHHELDMMNKRQRDLYLDIDQRLSNQSQVVASTPTISTPVTMPNDVSGAVSSEPISPEPVITEPTATPVIIPVAPSAPVAVENGEAAYQSALQTLRSGQYEQAITALSAFPEQYPNSNYLPNTYYWQGEANYVLRQFDAAITAFKHVIEQFPASSKVADATLKLGFSEYELGQTDTAKVTLTKVMNNYPNTSAARLAKVRLNKMK